MTTRNWMLLLVSLCLCGLSFQPICAQEKEEQNVVKKLDQKALTADMLTPTRVRFDWKDVPVRTAFADLAKKSNCAFDFAGDGKWIDKRRVTLDTGDVTFWEAVHALRRKAELSEQVNEKAAQRTIVLSDKIPPESPPHLAGSVRIRAVQPTKYVPAGESLFILDVAGEARLRPFGIVGAISVDKAVDDQGRMLTPIADVAPKPPQPAKRRGLPREVREGGGVVELIGHDLDPVKETPLRRSVPVRFKTGEKPVKMLKEISGKVQLQSLAKPEVVITFKDLAKAVGQKRSAEGYTLAIDDFEKTDDGRVKIKVTLTAPQGPHVGDNPFKNALFFGNGKILVDGVPLRELPGGGRPAPTMPKLVDAEGKVYQPRVTNLKTTALNNNLCCSDHVINGIPLTHILPGDFEHQATLVYSPSAEPASLQLFGQKLATYTVPFELKNVLLTSGK